MKTCTEIMQIIIDALDGERDRLGRLKPGQLRAEALRYLAIEFKIGGAEDTVDQAVKVMKAFLEKRYEGEGSPS